MRSNIREDVPAGRRFHRESGSRSQTGVQAHVFSRDAGREAATLQERSQWSREESVKPEAVGWKTECAAETVENKVACGAFFLAAVFFFFGRRKKASLRTGELYGIYGIWKLCLKCPNGRFF